MQNQPEETPCAPQADATQSPLSSTEVVETARLLKALGDPVRLQLVALISAHAGGEACVCDLTGAFDLSGPTISHHLKVLREAGVLTSQRRGTWVHYRVASGALDVLVDRLVALREARDFPTLVSAAAKVS